MARMQQRPGPTGKEKIEKGWTDGSGRAATALAPTARTTALNIIGAVYTARW